MDKRTVLGLIALSLILFSVNLYFNNQQAEQRRRWVEYQQALEKQKQEELSLKAEQQRVSLSQLPVRQVQIGDVVRAAVLLEGNLLFVAPSGDLPENIDFEGVEYQLATKADVGGSPVIYRSAVAKELPVGELSPYEINVLQLVEYDEQMVQYVAEHNRGKLTVLGASPQHNVLALVKTSSGYRPAGLYLHSERTLVPLEDVPTIASLLKKEAAPLPQVKTNGKETFYVLENQYQQLVISSKGGAIAEINLPFHSDENEASAVRSIEFDRIIAEDHPQNALFPAYSAKDGKGQDFEAHKGGYFPLLRRDLRPDDGDTIRQKPKHYAFNVVSDYPEVAELHYNVKEFDEKHIVLEAVQPHRRIIKTYTLGDAPYVLEASVNVLGNSQGLWISSGIPEVEWISGAPAPALKYRITRQNTTSVEQMDLPKGSSTASSIYPDWVCNSNGFMGIILDPLDEVGVGYRSERVEGHDAPSRLLEIDKDFARFESKKLPGYQILIPLKSSQGETRFRIFAGPFATDLLKAVDLHYTDPVTGMGPDYKSCQSFHGYFAFISQPFSKLLMVFMRFFHHVTNSWGASIILLTLVFRIMLYPLNAWSMRSMRRMQLASPHLERVKEKYKKDPQRQQMEILKLYREHKANPFSGCLPLLIQAPFLLGMLDLLKSTFELRGAPFIPGWIDDLTAPDVLFSWGFHIPLIGSEFHLLPILTGGVMFLQSKLSSSLPKDRSTWTDQQRQQATMMNMMGVMMTVLFYNFPSGLNLYWLCSMLLGIVQQWVTNKQLDRAGLAAPVPAK